MSTPDYDKMSVADLCKAEYAIRKRISEVEAFYRKMAKEETLAGQQEIDLIRMHRSMKAPHSLFLVP